MKKRERNLIIIALSILFTIIFYKQMMGLNLFVYNIILLGILFFRLKVFDLKNKLHLVVISGTLATTIAVLLHASAFSIVMNILSLILLFGIVNNRDLKLLSNVVFSSFTQFFTGFIFFFTQQKVPNKKYNLLKKITRWILPVLIISTVLVVFYLLYSASSSKFNSIFGFLGVFLSNLLSAIFTAPNFTMLLLLYFGFVISCGYFVKTETITVFKEPLTSRLFRTKSTKPFNFSTKLLTEFKTGVVLFLLLNVLLAVFNIIDIWHVWINFEWNGELMREFVHEGTYILIFTLFISIALVLFFFRKNLNFFSKNKPLKILANIWLAQNMVMTLSVLIRNLHYINYYNLAYLRIGVLLFIVIAITGLISVFIKINAPKNFFYLLRVNMLFTYGALIVFSLVNWDVVIAKFNFSRSQKAFVDLEFFSNFSNKALPFLDKTEDEVKSVEDGFVYKRIGKRTYFMEPLEYLEKIETRKSKFLKEYPTRSFLEWNYADWKAYKMLSAEVE